MDVRKIYEYALEREREGKRFFEENAGRLSHASAVSAFKRLAAEEQKHIEFIQALLDALARGASPAKTLDQELERARSFFAQRAETEKVDQTVSEAMVPDLPILRMAYLIERDFAGFCELAASKTEGEPSQILSKLAHWERSHENLFKQLHDNAFQAYAEMPWGG